jgi:hypothetical protein
VEIAQKLEGDWPVDRIEVVKRSPGRYFSRATEKRSGRPWQILNPEASNILRAIEHENCSLLHVFFGNVAIHLLPLLRRCSIPVVVSFHGRNASDSVRQQFSKQRQVATVEEIYNEAILAYSSQSSARLDHEP